VATEGLTRIRTLLETLDGLASAASGSGNTSLSFATLDAQFQSALREIDTVVAATTFNGTSILNGSASGAGAPTAQIGEDTSETITLDIADVSSSGLFPVAVALSSTATATTASAAVTTAQDVVDTVTAKIDAIQARIDSANASVKQDIFGVTQGIDTRLATDIEAENRSFDRNRLQQATAAALLAQALGVNSGLLGLLSAGARA
jgi:flagellin